MLLMLIIAMLMAVFVIYIAVKQKSQLKYIDDYRFHPAIRQKLKNKHSQLTDPELDLVFQGLRDYFTLCNRAKRHMVSMPSQIVDDAWHEFILFTRAYQGFCQRAIGRFLHHTPAEAMISPHMAQDGIKRAWRLACLKEKINPQAPTALPLLFAIDGQLGIANGFVYSLDCRYGEKSYCASSIGCGGGCSGGSCAGDSSDGGGDGCGGGGCGGD
ncbi:hypothetical protein JCM14076_17380 [Methylosoma difficile]